LTNQLQCENQQFISALKDFVINYLFNKQNSTFCVSCDVRKDVTVFDARYKLQFISSPHDTLHFKRLLEE